MPAQKLDTFQGKLLRINEDGTIPSDNPLLKRASGKYQAIWAYGCRNPFTFAIHPSSGEILINDVGGKFEEINRGVAGANYGWPTVEHGFTDKEGFVAPIHVYPQSSINGSDFAPSTIGDPYTGKYFFADFVHGWIKMIDLKEPRKSRDFASGLRRPVDLRFAADGSLYVLLRNAWVVDGKFEAGTGSLLKIYR
jgi:glucose/arabinose dehydrogenase